MCQDNEMKDIFGLEGMIKKNALRGTEHFARYIVCNYMMKFWRLKQKVITAHKNPL